MKLHLLFLVFFSYIGFSQTNYEKALDRVSTKTQAEIFLKRYKSDVKGELLSITKNNPENAALLQLPIGEIKTEELNGKKVIYKAISKGKGQSYRISLMEFDSNKTTIAEINSLRSFILKGIKNGEHKFENLARVYSSHPTAKTGGDIGWTPEGTFSKRFENVIKTKRIGQVFSYDEHRQKKHYVVVKTEENKLEDVVNVLKITEL
ncbi:parvulin-like peptidyl-prolyl cis-trans isomerase protein [Winogradskyella wandonensis]|uniref:Parvulin-like peptidyl-prolyl cis-trans isomerase protein n=1 Tax=Winogradskyella wandonensis TaxID=1442586 RepID=A0A4R1KY79_9FLAO|nr:peptidylprolyl isomerase [Winogradskyella wandonensis]TCK69159.1 parvulin-like peptidyl-prolyl cis-trans isomerase protein [Winogradskyella wandonensis]